MDQYLTPSGLFLSSGETNYDFFTTADGSPSICMSSERFRPEAMHHRQGALSESLFIYHGVLEEALQLGSSPRILSVGLGCAYNELLTVAHFLKLGRIPENFYLESFEGDAQLRNFFLDWLLNESIEIVFESRVHKQLHITYDTVCKLIGSHFGIQPIDLKNEVHKLYNSKQFVLRDWLTGETEFAHPFGVIMFDAFSNKSTPEIWQESFLHSFLFKAADETCGFATYAATGALNRALIAANFCLKEQRGFSGKRESTRAFKSGVIVSNA